MTKGARASTLMKTMVGFLGRPEDEDEEYADGYPGRDEGDNGKWCQSQPEGDIMMNTQVLRLRGQQ